MYVCTNNKTLLSKNFIQSNIFSKGVFPMDDLDRKILSREDGLYLEGIVKTEDLHCFEGYLV